MPAIFSKNCVVSGALDSYCLVCSQHLQTQEEALAHIQATQHRRNLHSTAYFDKYKQDYIKKVKGIYFCEVCNMTFATATKVGLHVTEEAHLINKRYNCIRRVNDHIVFHDNTAVTEAAWNGLVEDTCVLCNEDIDGDSTHKTDKKHLLNLITSKVTVDSNNVYREINDICQCLTCNKVVSGNIIMEHLNSKEHKSSLSRLDRNVIEMGKIKIVEDNDGTGDGKDRSFNDDNNACVENNDANTLKDLESKSLDGRTLFTKPVQMKDKKKPNSTNSVPGDVLTFAEQHGLSVKDGGRLYCDVCRSQVTPTLDSVKQHVGESKHKDNITVHSQINKKTSKNINKMSLEEFTTDMQSFELNGAPYIVINDKFCVHNSRLLGVVRSGERIICLMCPEDLSPNIMNILIHINTPRHATIMKGVSVITSLENEFIREIKPNIYDCCFCGQVARGWEIMREHLDSAEHKRKREQHDRLLQRYREHVIEEQSRQAMPLNWIALMSRMQQFPF